MMCVSCVEMEINNESPSAEELLRKIQELEARHALINQLMHQIQYLNILQSMGQAVFIYDLNHQIIFWNRGAENIYGYTAGEAIGQIPTKLLTDPQDAPLSEIILEKSVNGESWSGQFPVKNKSGERFVVFGANTPLHDDNGRLLGAMCVSSDSRPYQQPMHTSTALKISDSALKMKLKMKTGANENHSDNIFQSTPSRNNMEASGSWSSTLHVSSVDDEILWEDLITKQQIGQGSCGTVYQGLWYGSDVAVKVFAYQEFSDDVILSFRQEVSLMKRLRHPNILLFMGAVTCSPPHLCIVTEFLPRGSLFQILQRNAARLDWKRRLQMAIDIAHGMNYLHHCNPPIVHRDLKSSNLLVDKNWTVKVGDFGLSRIKHQTYLKTKSGKGTPQWMAPEIIRNEQANEKSDVYSYGVVLWEIVTGKVPWDDLNPIQVIAAVGFMNQRLEIPKDVDPLWASLIDSCWCSDPQSRPTFQEILYKLKDVKKKFAVERRR